MSSQDNTQQGTPPRSLRGIKSIAAYCGPGVSVHQVRAGLRAGDLPRLAGTGVSAVCLTADIDAWLISRRVTAPGRVA